MFCGTCGVEGATRETEIFGSTFYSCEDPRACELRVSAQVASSETAQLTEEEEARQNLDLATASLTFFGTIEGAVEHRYSMRGNLAVLMMIIPSKANGEIRYEYAESCGCCSGSFKVGEVKQGIPVLEPEFTTPKAPAVVFEPALF